MNEYSYFRVEPNGASERAIKTVEATEKERDERWSKWAETPLKSRVDYDLYSKRRDLYEAFVKSSKKQSSLEGIFECGEMPKKVVVAGRYSRSFVKAQDMIPDDLSRLSETDPQALYASENGRPGMGRIHDSQVVFATGQVDNPLMTSKLNNEWYIRVPNDEQGKPRFVPPDSKPVEYKDMMTADFCEYVLRMPSAPRNQPSGPR